MSTLNQLNAIDDKLLTELTAEEGEQASGGFGYYTIGNKSGIAVNYTFNGKQDSVGPNETRTYFSFYDPTVAFDRQIGPGYKPLYQTIKSKKTNFDRIGTELLLTGDGGPNANLV